MSEVDFRYHVDHGIDAMPFQKAAIYLLHMALTEMDAGYRLNSGRAMDNDIAVTWTRVLSVGAASIAREPGKDPRYEIFVDDDQSPWDALIVLLAEVAENYAVGGIRRHTCICQRAPQPLHSAL